MHPGMISVQLPPAFLAERSYVCTVLLGELLGIPYQIEAVAGLQHPRLLLPGGASLTIEDHFFGQLAEGQTYALPTFVPRATQRIRHPFSPDDDVICLFGNGRFSISDTEITCGIDFFAAAFFMLTRWEESALPDRDAYGRFPATASLAFRAGFLDRPVVNEYAELIGQLLERLGWRQPHADRVAQLHLSHDVDHPRLWWSAADRLRTLGGSLVQRHKVRETAWWLRRHFFRRQDPFDVFDTWMDLAGEKGLVSHFNFLGDRDKGTDCPYALTHPYVRDLIQKIHRRGHLIGFHPSREAFADPALFQRELSSVQAASPQPVRTGRQHYLCFSAPDTWQRWEDAGMEWDSTLGYPEAEGFRCGICNSFPVFQFQTRQVLRLREKPLLAMDVTLAQYRNYQPEEAWDRLRDLRRQVVRHGGEFVLLWHNSSWNTYFWAPWQTLYREFVQSF